MYEDHREIPSRFRHEALEIAGRSIHMRPEDESETASGRASSEGVRSGIVIPRKPLSCGSPLRRHADGSLEATADCCIRVRSRG